MNSHNRKCVICSLSIHSVCRVAFFGSWLSLSTHLCETSHHVLCCNTSHCHVEMSWCLERFLDAYFLSNTHEIAVVWRPNMCVIQLSMWYVSTSIAELFWCPFLDKYTWDGRGSVTEHVWYWCALDSVISL